jgi:hypothetical protein
VPITCSSHRNRTYRFGLAESGLARSGSLKYSWRRLDLTVNDYDQTHPDSDEAQAATPVRLPEPKGSEPSPSCLEALNRTLAAAHSPAPASHVLP